MFKKSTKENSPRLQRNYLSGWFLMNPELTKKMVVEAETCLEAERLVFEDAKNQVQKDLDQVFVIQPKVSHGVLQETEWLEDSDFEEE